MNLENPQPQENHEDGAKIEAELLSAVKHNYANGHMPRSAYDLDGTATATQLIQEGNVSEDFLNSTEYQDALKSRLLRQFNEEGRLVFPTGLRATEETLKDAEIQQLAKKQVMELLDVKNWPTESTIGLAQETVDDFLLDSTFTDSPEYVDALATAKAFVENSKESLPK